MKPKHFAGLDGLRFISITFVVLHHLFTFKTNFGFTNYDYPILGLIGLYGIHFFFMGSGFLITYLLLLEYADNGRISLRNFFLRRVLRIWPAYYLLIILALVVLLKAPFFRIPGLTDTYLADNYQRSNNYFFFFLPHLQSYSYPTAPYVHHTYTIGFEEQFYILWGVLFYLFRRWMPAFFMTLLVATPLLNALHDYIQLNSQLLAMRPIKIASSVITYIKDSRFSTFAVGSLFGQAYYHQKNWIGLFAKPAVQVAVYVILIVSIATQVSFPFIQNEFMAGIMACVMIIGTFKKESLINYSAGWLSWLGRISYGIYLFHIIAIVLASHLAVALFKTESSFLVTAFLIVVTMLLSIVFGWVSYHYFELYFLQLKRRFRKVKTAHE